MADKRKSVTPEGYNTLMPYLRVKGAAQAIDFYKAAFGARHKYRLIMGDRVGHAELWFGDCLLMLSDEFPEMGIVGPETLGGTSFTLALYVADVDKALAKAVAAGGKVTRPAQDEFYGCRSAQLADPFGHIWMLQTHLETVTPRQMQKRLDAMTSAGSPAPAKKKKA